LPDAQDELTRLSHLLGERYPETNRGTRSSAEAPRLLTVAPYSRIDPSARQQVVLIGFVVMGATGMLLLSACVNAGSLLLSRSAARRRELAVKLPDALAGRSRGRSAARVLDLGRIALALRS
jgi:hypothetical protein